MRYLEGGILEANAACRGLALGEGGIIVGGIEDMAELKDKEWGLGGGTGTGVLGGAEGAKKLNPLWPGLDGDGAPQEEVTE